MKGNFKQPKTLKVYLSPFIVDFENPDDSTSDIWYAAPEFLFNSPDFHNKTESDLWSIGCILFELYSHSPLFQVTDHHRKLVRTFEIIGFPQYSDIPYANQ